MQIGIVGLGRMGANIARHAMEKGHKVTGFNRDESATRELATEGLDAAYSLDELVGKLAAPRIVFIYVPHGAATEEVCDQLLSALSANDVLVDGGNSHWEDSRRRHAKFIASGIGFVDLGTSGGISGARTGACFMAGGEKSAFDLIAPLLNDLAIDEQAVIYAGAAGSGHFVKLIHNAIEFGMIQSIAEGLEMLERSDFQLDLPKLLTNWNHGSVIRGWLIELMAKAVQETPSEEDLSTYVEDTQEVKWVLNWAMDQDIPSPVISLAQQSLMQYRDLSWPAAKAVALLRNQFGGHPIHHLGDTPPRA